MTASPKTKEKVEGELSAAAITELTGLKTKLTDSRAALEKLITIADDEILREYLPLIKILSAHGHTKTQNQLIQK